MVYPMWVWPTLKMVYSGFLIGIQLSMGKGTLGMTGFFIGTPGIPPPMGGGGGGMGAPVCVCVCVCVRVEGRGGEIFKWCQHGSVFFNSLFKGNATITVVCLH